MNNFIEYLEDEVILTSLAYWKNEAHEITTNKERMQNIIDNRGLEGAKEYAESVFRTVQWYQDELERRLNVYSVEQLDNLTRVQDELIERRLVIDYTNIPVKKTYSPTGCLSLLLRLFGVKL